MKRVALYLRVSTLDQHPETQLYDVRQLAKQRGFQIEHEYTDKISGTRARRTGLDQLLADARCGKFDVVMVWAFDRLARSVKHLLEVLVMRRAKLEGRHIGRPALQIDQQALVRDRQGGMSLRQVAKTHGISRASVARVLQQPNPGGAA